MQNFSGTTYKTDLTGPFSDYHTMSSVRIASDGSVIRPGKLFQDGKFVGASNFSTDEAYGCLWGISIFYQTRFWTDTTDIRISSIRLYDRELTDEEVAANREVDIIRFNGQ